MIDDALLNAAQESAWARACILMNLGQPERALKPLFTAVDWDSDLYPMALCVWGWQIKKTDLMTPGWLYLNPNRSMLLSHPDTADLLFYNSGTMTLVRTFDESRVHLMRVGEIETTTAMDAGLDDLLYQSTIPMHLDPDDAPPL